MFAFAMNGTLAKEKLKIDLYIESLCVFSKAFMENQFSSAYNSIKNDVEVRFFTFGKSSSYVDRNHEVQFICQHGPEECEKNKIQTCALNFIGNNQDRQADFMMCTMKITSTSQTFQECAQSINLKYDDLEECAKGKLGTKLQLDMKTASLSIIQESGHVPTIVYDEKYNETDLFSSLHDFKKVVMEKLEKKREEISI